MPEAPGDCPASAAHRRLMDCHVHWHALSDKYMDPDGFRVQLNALIQDLRNVTWVLQKQKANLPDFANWYGAWQESVKGDTVMKWVVKARNRIVKEADLQLHSQARVRFSADWLRDDEMTMVVPPRFTTRQIMATLMRARPASLQTGLLSVERRWVESRLPDWEILKATAHAYDRLATVVGMAHMSADMETCGLPPRDRPCVTAEIDTSLPCMRVVDADRRLDIDIGAQQEIAERHYKIEEDEDTILLARERYGALTVKGDAIERVPVALEMAKAMLAADGRLVPVAWLLRGDRTLVVQPLSFYNQTSKRLAMHKLADQIQRIDADGVILISESWMALPQPDEDLNDPNITRPEDRPDRLEAVTVDGITRDGRKANRIAFFSRDDDDQIVFGETHADVEGQNNMVVPILRKWQEV